VKRTGRIADILFRKRMNKYRPEIIAFFLLCFAFLVLFHQYYIAQSEWFHFNEIQNHESLALALITCAIGVVIGKHMGRS
jgi:hypothetical protein